MPLKCKNCGKTLFEGVCFCDECYKHENNQKIIDRLVVENQRLRIELSKVKK